MAYLLTQEISTQIECIDAGRDRWEIWIRQEDQLATAMGLLREFSGSPNDPKYASAVESANRILVEKEKLRLQAIKNQRRLDVRSARPGVGLGGRRGPLPPLTLTLLILSIVISVVSGLGSPAASNGVGVTVNEQLRFVSSEDLRVSGGDAAASLKRGEIWRAITPIFLHLDLLHLAMNMFVLVSFGKIVENWLGTPRFALFVLLLSIGPNLLQGLSPDWLQGSPKFGGISGVLYGFFGYVWLRSVLNPGLGISIPLPIAFIFIGVIVLGLSGVFPALRMAHLAHLGGLLIGSAMGYASERT